MIELPAFSAKPPASQTAPNDARESARASAGEPASARFAGVLAARNAKTGPASPPAAQDDGPLVIKGTGKLDGRPAGKPLPAVPPEVLLDDHDAGLKTDRDDVLDNTDAPAGQDSVPAAITPADAMRPEIVALLVPATPPVPAVGAVVGDKDRATLVATGSPTGDIAQAKFAAAVAPGAPLAAASTIAIAFAQTRAGATPIQFGGATAANATPVVTLNDATGNAGMVVVPASGEMHAHRHPSAPGEAVRAPRASTVVNPTAEFAPPLPVNRLAARGVNSATMELGLPVQAVAAAGSRTPSKPAGKAAADVPVAISGAAVVAGDLQPAMTLREVQAQIQSAANPVSASSSPAADAQRCDVATLVDRLVEARAAAQPQNVQGALTHHDFGRIELRFNDDPAGLAVALSSRDPDFAPAVQAAAAAAAGQGSTSGDDRGGGGPRPDGPAQQAQFGAAGNGQAQPQSQGSSRNGLTAPQGSSSPGRGDGSTPNAEQSPPTSSDRDEIYA